MSAQHRADLIVAEALDREDCSRGLRFEPYHQVAERVDTTSPIDWLWRPVWPGDAYGVLAAAEKAGKSWAALDAAVSVAAGTPWLGIYPCDSPGPVLLLWGEGDERSLRRRLAAVAAHYGVDDLQLPLRVCSRVPSLTNTQHLEALRREVEENPPRLIILDPLYLAASGVDSNSLHAMGRVLGEVQDIAQQASAALLVVTHFRKGGTDEPGARRINGVGPGAWGRVLATAAVRRRHTDPVSQRTEVTLDFEFVGGEIPDSNLRLRRTIWAESDDLKAALHYSVQQLETVEDDGAHTRSDLSPAARKLLEALQDLGEPATISQLGDSIAARHGHGLRRETCSKELNGLLGKGLVTRHEDAPGRPARWSLTSTPAA